VHGVFIVAKTSILTVLLSSLYNVRLRPEKLKVATTVSVILIGSASK
jgi:hypothetical protein